MFPWLVCLFILAKLAIIGCRYHHGRAQPQQLPRGLPSWSRWSGRASRPPKGLESTCGSARLALGRLADGWSLRLDAPRVGSPWQAEPYDRCPLTPVTNHGERSQLRCRMHIQPDPSLWAWWMPCWCYWWLAGLGQLFGDDIGWIIENNTPIPLGPWWILAPVIGNATVDGEWCLVKPFWHQQVVVGSCGLLSLSCSDCDLLWIRHWFIITITHDSSFSMQYSSTFPYLSWFVASYCQPFSTVVY